MKVAIGSPSVVKGAGGRLLLDWASRVDAGPFSSLGSLDIVSSYGYEPLTVLAAAAAVTQRVRLMTNIMLGPVRNSLILAKQALSIDAISGGRLSPWPRRGEPRGRLLRLSDALPEARPWI